MIIWYKSKYLQCFGSAIKRRLICFRMTQTKSVFWFFTLSAESVIHIELSTLRICQLCINRNSHKAWSCTVSRMLLRCSTHASGIAGQWDSHTELVPVPLHQVLVEYIFKLKTWHQQQQQVWRKLRNPYMYTFYKYNFSNLLPGLLSFFPLASSVCGT